MKKIIITLYIILLCFSNIHSQSIDTTAIELNNAIALINGYRGRINTEEAIKTIRQYASHEVPRAVNALGLCYMEGKGLPQDTLKGLNHLLRAAELGYSNSWHNLGVIYKYGLSGVKQNFNKAFEYMELCAQSNNPRGLYDAGYMRYKGLGCTQNYEKAFEYFKQGAELKSTSSAYMLGLCYRNGYGTGRNSGEANYWLTQAANKGHKASSKEQASDEPENSVVKASMSKVKATNPFPIPEKFIRIKQRKESNKPEIGGAYEGLLVTYDWSGEKALSQHPIKLNIEQAGNGDQLLIEWNETGVDTMFVNATMQDTCIVFTQAMQNRADHYSAQNGVLWNFTQGKINLTNEGADTYLTGNINMYSPQEMEPHKPVYITLKKVVSNAARGTAEFTTDNSDFCVYPNPAEYSVNMRFTLPNESDVRILIYSTNGQIVYNNRLGKYTAGKHDISIEATFKEGTYIVKLITVNKEYQTTLIKK
ncbi:MAG: T9SS type A sorting domain-containing protein [Paludibacteraceae bacterium]